MLNESQNRSNDINDLASSEDSLQRYVKIKKINFLKRLGVLVVLWSLIVAYFVLPISKVRTPSLEGNKNLTINDIIDIAGVRSTDYLWENNTADQVERLSKHPLIDDVEISVNIFGVHIAIKEKYPLAKIQASINCNDIACYNYYLSDLTMITGETVFQSKPLKKAISSMKNLPVLTNIEDENILNSILEQLSKIDYKILENIVSVSYVEDYLETKEIKVIRLVIAKQYLNLDANLMLYVDMNRLSYKISESHLFTIAKYIKPSAKIDDTNYCLSYLSNQTASCKESVK